LNLLLLIRCSLEGKRKEKGREKRGKGRGCEGGSMGGIEGIRTDSGGINITQ